MLLGVLLLHAGEVVSPTRLMHELWGETLPSSAAKGVQGYVSGLRRILGPDAIATRTRGYVVAPDCSTPPCSSAWRPLVAFATRWRCGAGSRCRGWSWRAAPP